MIGVVYLGDNPKTEEKLKYVPGRLVRMERKYKKAAEACESHVPGDHFIVFVEKSEPIEDVTSITYLRRSLNNIYLVLLTPPLTNAVSAVYKACGINDTLDVDATVTEINKKIQFVCDKESVLFEKLHAQYQIDRFKIPLWKRLFDIVVSAAAIIALSPLFILTAIAIKMESAGPVVFRSKRVGTNYKVFDFLKFRSMYVNAEAKLKELSKTENKYAETRSDGTPMSAAKNSHVTPITPKEIEQLDMNGDDVMLIGDDYVVSEDEFAKMKAEDISNAFVKIENDPRVTRVGRFIRKYSIDELPQLFNILKGDMSVVGNRPLPLYEAEKLTVDNNIDRFMAPAGLTGLWQVEERSRKGKMSADERKQLDIIYGQKYSFALDMKIILKTFTAFIQKDNV